MPLRCPYRNHLMLMFKVSHCHLTNIKNLIKPCLVVLLEGLFHIFLYKLLKTLNFWLTPYFLQGSALWLIVKLWSKTYLKMKCVCKHTYLIGLIKRFKILRNEHPHSKLSLANIFFFGCFALTNFKNVIFDKFAWWWTTCKTHRINSCISSVHLFILFPHSNDATTGISA